MGLFIHKYIKIYQMYVFVVKPLFALDLTVWTSSFPSSSLPTCDRHPLCYVDIHTADWSDMLAWWLNPRHLPTRCVGPVVPQCSHRPRSVLMVSRTHTEDILFVRLEKDQSSRTIIATMCNFPPPLPASHPTHSALRIFGFWKWNASFGKSTNL